MKTLFVLFCSSLIAGTAVAQPLSQADREALLDSLEKLHKEVDSQNEAIYSMAISAYRQAMSSDDKAAQFYLDCTEKVEFTDMKRKSRSVTVTASLIATVKVTVAPTPTVPLPAVSDEPEVAIDATVGAIVSMRSVPAGL